MFRLLAEPNLTAISGEPAKFLAGGEYPIPVKDSNGQTSVSPTRNSECGGLVHAHRALGGPHQPQDRKRGERTHQRRRHRRHAVNSTSIPALKKRQANSTVELPSGGSIALAGLISDDVRQNIDGFPGLKDVSILGTLFRSRDFIKRETELVIIVTPYLVKPVAPKALAKPLDGLAESADRKANFMGHLNRIYGTESAAPVGDLKGDYGFIVE